MAYRPLSKRTKEHIVEMLTLGTPRATIAKTLGISRAVVYKEIARLKEAETVQVVAPVVRRREPKVPDEEQLDRMAGATIDAAEQLSFVVIKARDIIKRLEEKAADEMDPARAGVIARLLDSLRGAVGEWMKLIALLRSAEEIREFQEEVLAAINVESPAAAARIRRRIEERRNARLVAAGVTSAHVDTP